MFIERCEVEGGLPELLTAPRRTVRSRVFDSDRWAGYQPRPDDIVIATYSKCGTTWTQRIVAMLVMGSAEPASIWDLSPWLDMRIFGPIEDVLSRAEAQTHRRFFKSHLPFDALPVYSGVKFIHVARDGRDAALSLHNHLANFTPQAMAMLDEVSVADEKFGDPYPRTPRDPAQFFHKWVEDGGDQGDPGCGFYHVENSFWSARGEPNLLLVHYADLKADLEGEMRRIADFLDIQVDEGLWPQLVNGARFETMKRQGQDLLPAANMLWEGGANRFLNQGSNGRWRDAFAPADLAAYERRVQDEFSPALAAWLEAGRLRTGDPKLTAD
jgi:aryl sulfotransferase